jgi:hypothetical protein
LSGTGHAEPFAMSKSTRTYCYRGCFRPPVYRKLCVNCANERYPGALEARRRRYRARLARARKDRRIVAKHDARMRAEQPLETAAPVANVDAVRAYLDQPGKETLRELWQKSQQTTPIDK